jgi:hypothetical protein
MSSLVSQTVVFTVSCGFSTLFINAKPLRRFAFRTFAFLSPYRRLKATISYPDVLHRSKDQPFKTFHVFFIPFFLCLILYLFTLYYLALTSAAIPHIIYISFEFSQIFLQTNREGAGKRWIVKKDWSISHRGKIICVRSYTSH